MYRQWSSDIKRKNLACSKGDRCRFEHGGDNRVASPATTKKPRRRRSRSARAAAAEAALSVQSKAAAVSTAAAVAAHPLAVVRTFLAAEYLQSSGPSLVIAGLAVAEAASQVTTVATAEGVGEVVL